jgi:hypothetical protein
MPGAALRSWLGSVLGTPRKRGDISSPSMNGILTTLFECDTNKLERLVVTRRRLVCLRKCLSEINDILIC